MRISDWSSDVCSSDLEAQRLVDRDLQRRRLRPAAERQHHGKGGEAEHEDQARDTRQHAAQGRPFDEAEEAARSEEHTSELQSLMRISYAVFCVETKITQAIKNITQLMTAFPSAPNTMQYHQ